MDSLNRENGGCLSFLRAFLDEEHAAKKGGRLNIDEWTLAQVRRIPQQKNTWICGVSALKFAEYASQDVELNFDQGDMPYFRRRKIVDLAGYPVSASLLTAVSEFVSPSCYPFDSAYGEVTCH